MKKVPANKTQKGNQYTLINLQVVSLKVIILTIANGDYFTIGTRLD